MTYIIMIFCLKFDGQVATQSNMTDESDFEHLSVVMTTELVDDDTHTTAANVLTPSQSSGIQFYFQCAVVIIGVGGTATNALILYAMVASKQHKKQALIFNQNLLDLFSSLLLIMTYTAKLCNIYLIGLGGYWLCMLLLSENLLWSVIIASKANLMFVTIERYLKVVFPIWSRKYLRQWMVFCAAIFAWINGIVTNMAATFVSTDVIDGVCYAYVLWKTRKSQLAYGLWYFLVYYAIELSVFMFCYGHMLISIRHQAKVMAHHSIAGPSTTHTQSNKVQLCIVKTMILISAFYAISNLPMDVYYLILNIHANLTITEAGYYGSMFATFFYICANPFIYAFYQPIRCRTPKQKLKFVPGDVGEHLPNLTVPNIGIIILTNTLTNPFIYAVKFDPVKEVLLRLIRCRQSSIVAIETIELT